ncbi:uncharacterized protein BO97DRAFT_458962 [Aspergillus homomorphus CBS 101889]|uniref:ribonuclease T1 n=1 Tax=Aspergillus homomorphus (strain CBS 101889) TaxID=1450537 RepID=A0A395I759_ASPHC|nr:hypothetical protein BO97DRAFT_458962 [Aspergillus homomorphus CBS 101889]RAL15961.1 hypothetical protein BO97DRAFT_458962 [Aspergillus homomorphus CBS 101889]
MPSIKTFIFHTLLAGALMSQSVLAYYLQDPNASLEQPDIVEDIDKRSNTVPKLSTAEVPSKSYTCPQTSRYAATTYTAGQLKKVYFSAAKLANGGKQLGKNKYPHHYANHENLPFPCGSNMMEFVLDRDHAGDVYGGDEVTTFPDRLIFEYSTTSKTAKARFCGVIRHGDDAFVNCLAT